MDLSTVARKLDRLEYSTARALFDDVDLIWDNAIKFNGADTWIGKAAAELREIAKAKLAHAEAAYEQVGGEG
jgi:cytochrome c556